MPNLGSETSGGDPITIADRVLGVFVVAAAVLTVIAARSTASLLPAFALLALGAAYVERTSLRRVTEVQPTTALVAAFLVVACLSAAWSADPAATLAHNLFLLFMLLQWQILDTWISAQPLRRVRHLSWWYTVAVLAGVAVLTFEVWAHQYIRRLIIEHFDILVPPTLDKHYRINPDGGVRIFGFELNRSIAAANMLMWPALLSAAAHWTGRTFEAMAAALIGGVGLATLGSSHETSKIAFIVGLLIYVAARLWPRAATATLHGVWTLLILGIVPASLMAFQVFDLQESSWLQHSARERIVIWNDISKRVLDAPWLGVGARTAYVLSEDEARNLGKEAKSKHKRIIARHAHNVYLQTWFEMGLVGALLLLFAGIAVVLAAGQLAEPVRPYALATFAVFMAEIGSSWEIWQRWFFALFALAAVFLALGVRSFGAGPAARAPSSALSP